MHNERAKPKRPRHVYIYIYIYIYIYNMYIYTDIYGIDSVVHHKKDAADPEGGGEGPRKLHIPVFHL